MKKIKIGSRINDIKPPNNEAIKIYINSEEKIAYKGETILSTLFSYGIKQISKNDHNQKIGAYCGMGICFCCLVSIDNSKYRACKTIVKEGMHINTVMNTDDIVESYANTKSL